MKIFMRCYNLEPQFRTQEYIFEYILYRVKSYISYVFRFFSIV
jgi:hypothetical protein